ncbi:hypothetical protein BDR26DRAFT_917019 [Obelidium mucronatum]|nr:hypothetical protein BDR26DRAFT_917019 [Obelidium mucronatum]
MAVLLDEKRVMMEQKVKDVRKTRLDERRMALTAIHSEKVKVRGDEKRVRSAHVMLASTIADTRLIERELRGQSAVVHSRANRSKAKPAATKTLHKMLSILPVDSRRITEYGGEARSRKQSVAFKGIPPNSTTSETQDASQGISLENASPPFRRKSSAAFSTHGFDARRESSTSQSSNGKADFEGSGTNFVVQEPTGPPPKQKLYRGSAYKKQAQELAQIRVQCNADILPIAKRYDSSKIKEAVNGIVKHEPRKSHSADPRLSSSYPTDALLKSYKLKYLNDRAITIKIPKETAAMTQVEDIQNTVFQRLSQKKHMLVQATKNRKKASKFNFNDKHRASGTYSTSVVSAGGGPGGRFSTVAVGDLDETSNGFGNFEEEGESDDEEEEMEAATSKAPEPEQEWNNPKSIALFKVVAEKIKEGRRGPTILASLPERAKTAPRISATKNPTKNGREISAASQRVKSANSSQSASSPRNIGSAQPKWDIDDDSQASLFYDRSFIEPTQAPQSHKKDPRVPSASTKVRFDIQRNSTPSNGQTENIASSKLSDLVQWNDLDESARNEDDAPTLTDFIRNTKPPLRDTFATHQFKSEKWEPLRMSALDDFRKTIIPTCMKQTPVIQEIAAAVEERISLPKIMRVWVNPDGQFE